jgi:hypothetical protein
MVLNPIRPESLPEDAKRIRQLEQDLAAAEQTIGRLRSEAEREQSQQKHIDEILHAICNLGR